ncbi:hypothetical protein [Maribacter sp. HTCC2170]|uniref:hypothetical protein n=1 Tax=Maribacter sp. (strain HTCC2170 / KCCM 42371) TaxID=313603 RepID=UPI00006AFC5A|nr:hypothetical protein [Maribacter sp. HTCC2170]EAR01342.1 hypothetical protein FB2170_11496 [Maribacter sp. HTCC2170]
MVLFIILVVLCLVIVYLLFVKLVFFIDTANNEYYIQLKGLAKAYIEPDKEELVRVHIKALFMNFYIYPFDYVGKSGKKKISKKHAVKKKKSFESKKIVRLLQTFKVNKFLIDIDTGNCITNAKLYPMFSALNHHIGHFRINFYGNNQLVLHMQNRPINIIKTIINT